MSSEMNINYLVDNPVDSIEQPKPEREGKLQGSVEKFLETYVWDIDNSDTNVNHKYEEWLSKNELKAMKNPQREIDYDELPIIEFPDLKGYGIQTANSLSKSFALIKNSQTTGNQLQVTDTSNQQLAALNTTNTNQPANYLQPTTQNICFCGNLNCTATASVTNTNLSGQATLGFGEPLLIGPQYQQLTSLAANQPANFPRPTEEKSCIYGTRNCIQATYGPKEPPNAGSYPLRAGYPPGLASSFPPPGLTYQHKRNSWIYASSTESAYPQKTGASSLGSWMNTPVINPACTQQLQTESNFGQYTPPQSYISAGLPGYRTMDRRASQPINIINSVEDEHFWEEWIVVLNGMIRNKRLLGFCPILR